MAALYLKLRIMKTNKTYTKRPYLYRSFRLPEADVRLWMAAAGELGISQADFLRTALREKAKQILVPNTPRETDAPRPAA
jgi:hypothetical protein